MVVLNPSAHGGSGARRFEDVRPLIESSFDARIVAGRPDGEWQTEVRDALGQGVRVFIAAGGDGTAHALLGTLARTPHRPALETLVLGAVGLGSSNELLQRLFEVLHHAPRTRRSPDLERYPACGRRGPAAGR